MAIHFWVGHKTAIITTTKIKKNQNPIIKLFMLSQLNTFLHTPRSMHTYLGAFKLKQKQNKKKKTKTFICCVMYSYRHTHSI